MPRITHWHTSPFGARGNLLSRMPVELASKIFELCLPEEVVPSTKNAPLHITHVCQQWRKIAHATPTLWASLTINNVRAVHITHLGLLTRWLARSGNLPISLSLSQPDTDELSDYEQAHASKTTRAVIDAVTSYSYRWFRLTVDFPYEFLDNDSWSEVYGNLDRLNSITIRSSLPLPGDIFEPINYISRAPSLREARIGGGLCRELVDNLPWNQLTSLDITLDHRQYYIDIISQCGSLQELSVDWHAEDFEFQPEFESEPAKPFVVPCLRSLVISTGKRDAEVLPDILKLSNMPSLMILHMRPTSSLDAHAFQDFVLRSECRITDLTLSYTVIKSKTIIELLKPLQWLKRLSVDHNCTSEGFMQSLIVQHDSQPPAPFLPRLQEFLVTASTEKAGHIDKAFKDSTLMNMVRSRSHCECRACVRRHNMGAKEAAPGLCTLKSLSLTICWELKIQTLLDLGALRQFGLNVTVVFDDGTV